MLTQRPDPDPITPETDMVGECKVCGTVVKAKRRHCRRGHFDLLYSECPACKERSPSKAGGAVEMRRQPMGPEKL